MVSHEAPPLRLNSDQLPAALNRGLAPVYLVSGDEPLLIGETADAVRAAARTSGYLDRTVFFVDRSFDWNELRHATQALSLFAERRLFELRMPSGKPDKGAAQLAELATNPPPDVICLIVTDKLDRKSSEAPWVRAIERHGVWIPIWPVETAALPAWLRGRARGLKVELQPAAAQLIVDRVEGNLLAAKQELEKLALLANGGSIDADLVMRAVGDSARYDVFQLAEAAAAGDAQRSLRVLLGLKSEGVEPTLILWALVRELRGLWQARERTRLRSHSAGAGWNQAAKPSDRALSRIGAMPLARLLRQAGQTDRIIKGLAGGDAWTAIIGLTASMAGALQASRESGRVAS
jgi:DNA polymerase-3 subunit delta